MSVVNLQKAGDVLAVANTPMFLLRELSDEPSIQTLLHTMPPDKVFDSLQKSLQIEPKTLSDAVLPYVYLIALSHGDRSYLHKAATLEAPFSEWYAVIAEALLQRYKPTTTQSFVFPSVVVADQRAMVSNNNKKIFRFDEP